MSEKVKTALQSAKTGEAALDELAHYVGKELPETFTTFDIAITATLLLTSLNNGSGNRGEFPAICKYLEDGNGPLHLGAKLTNIFTEHVPEFAQIYADTSRLFFGA